MILINFHSKEQDLRDHADEYQRLAVGILTKCYEENPDKTRDLLIRKLDKWGGLTCLQLAVDSESREIVSHPAVQYLLNKIWFGGMTTATPKWRMFLGVVPFFASYITFETGSSKYHPESSSKRRKKVHPVRSSSTSNNVGGEASHPDNGSLLGASKSEYHCVHHRFLL